MRVCPCNRTYTKFAVSSRHIGKTYRPPQGETLERAAALGELRERLRRAIENEQFELAADLRDRIRVLE